MRASEILAESEEKRCQQCGMKNCKCPGDSCKCNPIAGWVPNKGFRKAVDEAANAAQQAVIAINMKKHHKKPKAKNMAEATGDEKFDTLMGRMTAEPKYPDKEMPPTSIPELIQWAQENRKPYHGYFAQWAQRNKFTNVNDALEWFGDNVDPSNPWGPKDRENVFGRPAAEELQDAAKHDPKAAELMKVYRCYEEIVFDWPDDYRQMNMSEDLAEEFDLIESIIERLAEHNGVDAELIWADLETLTEDELYAFAVTSEPIMESEAWQKANNRDKTDGMSQKAVNVYRREHPGSKLKTAVTTKPSKLKKGSKASKRRKSYCSRSRGQMKMHSISCAKTPDKAICKARRRWNC